MLPQAADPTPASKQMHTCTLDHNSPSTSAITGHHIRSESRSYREISICSAVTSTAPLPQLRAHRRFPATRPGPTHWNLTHDSNYQRILYGVLLTFRKHLPSESHASAGLGTAAQTNTVVMIRALRLTWRRPHVAITIARHGGER